MTEQSPERGQRTATNKRTRSKTKPKVSMLKVPKGKKKNGQ